VRSSKALAKLVNLPWSVSLIKIWLLGRSPIACCMANLMDRRIERMRACHRADGGVMKSRQPRKAARLDGDGGCMDAPIRTDAGRRPRRGYDPAIGQTLNKVLV
jgi:hypothetical protein